MGECGGRQQAGCPICSLWHPEMSLDLVGFTQLEMSENGVCKSNPICAWEGALAAVDTQPVVLEVLL